MFSILFVLISRTPLFFLKAISFFIYIFARTLKVSHLNITKKNINHCFGDNKELVNKSFRETMELSLIFPFIWGKKDNYKKLKMIKVVGFAGISWIKKKLRII